MESNYVEIKETRTYSSDACQIEISEIDEGKKIKNYKSYFSQLFGIMYLARVSSRESLNPNRTWEMRIGTRLFDRRVAFVDWHQDMHFFTVSESVAQVRNAHPCLFKAMAHYKQQCKHEKRKFETLVLPADRGYQCNASFRLTLLSLTICRSKQLFNDCWIHTLSRWP